MENERIIGVVIIKTAVRHQFSMNRSHIRHFTFTFTLELSFISVFADRVLNHVLLVIDYFWANSQNQSFCIIQMVYWLFAYFSAFIALFLWEEWTHLTNCICKRNSTHDFISKNTNEQKVFSSRRTAHVSIVRCMQFLVYSINIAKVLCECLQKRLNDSSNVI